MPGLLEKAESLTAGRTDISKPLEYHVAHVYHVFAETTKGVFGEEGKEITRLVMEAFRTEYGAEMTGRLLELSQSDFETIEG